MALMTGMQTNGKLLKMEENEMKRRYWWIWFIAGTVFTVLSIKFHENTKQWLFWFLLETISYCISMYKLYLGRKN